MSAQDDRWIWRCLVAGCMAFLLVAGGVRAGLAQEGGQGTPAPTPEQIQGPQQVLVEVLIFEIETSKASELGVDLTYARGTRGREDGSSIREIALRTLSFSRGALVTVPTADTGPTPGTTIRPDLDSASGIQTLPGMTLAGDVIIGDRGAIFGRMRALVNKGDARMVSRPIVVVADGKSAEIHVGGEVPYQALKFDPYGNPVLDVAFEKVGVDLKVTPTIDLKNNTVQMRLDQINVAALSRTETIRGIDMPYFSSRKEATTVTVPDKQLLVIGGLRSKSTRETVRRVPVLGKIPVLGFFFRSTDTSMTETELRIYITPTILKRGEEARLPSEFTRVKDARKKIEEEF